MLSQIERMLSQVKTEEELRNIVKQYVMRVGVKKATDESLMIMARLGNTHPLDLEKQSGTLMPTARFRLMVLEYLYADEKHFEKDLRRAAKRYLYASKRDSR